MSDEHSQPPNAMRALERLHKGNACIETKDSQQKRKERIVIPDNPSDSVFR